MGERFAVGGNAGSAYHCSVQPSPDPVVVEPDPPNLAEAGTYPTAREAFEHGLVVLALGSPFWLLPADQGYRLMVEPAMAEVAREQLSHFDRESVDWPPRPLAAGPARAGLTGPLLWCIVVLFSFGAQGRWPGWTSAGAVDARAMLDDGEWWRAFTALFLHADFGHLVSNAFSGVFVFAAVLAAQGRRRGWLLLAAAGTLGNVAAALLHHAGAYRSLGASTAIFGALGLLTGRALAAIARSPAQRWRTMFVPLASGLAVLGLYGAGGVDIDVLAHATGFAAGLVLGLLAATRPRSDDRLRSRE